MIRRPSTQLLLIVLGVSLFAWLYDPSDERYPDAATQERQRELPKTYLIDTRSWVYDEDGNLSEVLDTASAEYYLDGDETFLVSPRFYSHHDDDRTWSASAERGVMNHAGDTLSLFDKVLLISDQTGGRLETEAMKIDLERKVARSRSPVLLTQGQNTTRADGMVANLERERMQLMPNVESIYVVQ